MEVIVSPKRRFLQESHGVPSQKTVVFIVIAMKTSTLTKKKMLLVLEPPVYEQNYGKYVASKRHVQRALAEK
jgi:hypothetical protein